MIICDVCKKPVERMQYRDDMVRDSRIIAVFCHGEQQSFEVHHSLMSQSDLNQITLAFVSSSQALEGCQKSHPESPIPRKDPE